MASYFGSGFWSVPDAVVYRSNFWTHHF